MEKETTILISELRQRKSAACQQLLATYGPMVFRMVQRIVPLREDAEEVYQDVFVKALRGIEGYNPQQATLATWLNRIAYHESLNFIRGKSPVIVSIDEHEWGTNLLEAPDDEPQNEQTIQQLEQALEKLPAHEQAIVSMFYYDNMSLADIAFVTGSITSTVGSQLSRIRKKLYRMIKSL